METFDESTVLRELEHRYSRDQIFTYIGEILVLMNPFKLINGLYASDKVLLYRNVSDKAAAPP